MKNKTLLLLGITGALYGVSSVAVHSSNERVQKLGALGLVSSLFTGVSTYISHQKEPDDYDDDPRMQEVYDELSAQKQGEEPEPDETDDDMENDPEIEASAATQQFKDLYHHFNHRARTH